MSRKVNLSASSARDVSFSKLSAKERAKQMAGGGMPDDWDFQNISREFKKFDKRYPGLLGNMAAQVYKEVESSGANKHGEVNSKIGMRRGYWLPAPLQHWVETAYPTIGFGANMKHVHWFMRKFPIFSYETYTRATKVK